MLKNIKRSFVTGILMLTPLGVTFVIIKFLLEKVGQPASALFFGPWNNLITKQWLQWIANITSILFVIILITLFGWLSKFFLGKSLLRFTESFIQNIPFISTIYTTVKQMVDTVSKSNQAVFQKAVLVQFPSKEIYSIGFLTNKSNGEVQTKTRETVCNVFVPTTPNPTSGFLIMVPENELIPLDMSISDAIKLIISGGTVTPTSEVITNGND